MENRVEAGSGRARSALIFWVFLLVHVAVWTLVPSLRNHNFPLDVVEHLAWGREWEFGYHKHPPMVSWMLEAAVSLFGRGAWVVYGLSQACIALAFLAVWRLARTMLPPWRALGAVLACEGVIYHTFTSPEFNVNVASLPFWAIVLAESHRLFASGPDEQRKPTWVVLGLAMGGAFLTKYTAVLLGLGVLTLLLLPPAWHWWRKPGPWLALGVFTLTVLPHIVWLFLHGFPTFQYALARGDDGAAGMAAHLLAPAGFLGGQLAAIAPALLLAALAWPWRPRLPSPLDRQDQYLLVMGLGPIALLVIIALIFGFELKAMWGTTLFLLLGVMMMRWLRPLPEGDSPTLRRAAAGLVAVMLLGPLIYLAEPAVANGVLGRAKRTQFPGPELARVMETRWHDRFGGPLRIVIGDEWLAGSVSAYAADRPSAFLNADRQQAPWIKPGDVRKVGAIVLWMADKRGSRPAALAESSLSGLAGEFPLLEEQPPITLPWAATGGLDPVHIGWAIIPPQAEDGLPPPGQTDMK